MKFILYIPSAGFYFKTCGRNVPENNIHGLLYAYCICFNLDCIVSKSSDRVGGLSNLSNVYY